MPGGIQEFARAVAARQRRGDEAEAGPAQRLDATAHGLTRVLQRRLVLHGALDEPGAADFELRLDKAYEPRGARRERQNMRQDKALRDEADVADDRLRRLADEIGGESARVEALVRGDARIRGEARVEL